MITKQITQYQISEKGRLDFFDEPTNDLLIKAAKGDYKDFFPDNIKEQKFENLPFFPVVKIDSIEYIISGYFDDQNKLKRVTIYNYDFIEKWLQRHNMILGNDVSKVDIDILDYIEKEAKNYNIKDRPKLFKSLEKLFSEVILYHCPDFDPTWKGGDAISQILKKHELVRYWFNKMQRSVIDSQNLFIQELQYLFHRLTTAEFFALRDFAVMMTQNILGQLTKKDFYIGYNPFQDDILKLGKVIMKNYPDEKIKLKLDIENIGTEKEPELLKNEPQPKPKNENPYPEIFPDVFSFTLFERLHNDYKDSNNLLADYSFIYRKMWDLGHILNYQKPEMFKDWLSKEPYKIVLGNKFKTLDHCKTDSKENNFNLTFDLIEKL